MPFPKGVSGNPGGRPKGLGTALRAKYGEDGGKIIAELERFAFGRVKTCPAHVRVHALEILLERGWGKAPQVVAGDPDQPMHLKVIFGGRFRPETS